MSLTISAETTFLLDMINDYGPELNTTANAISDPAGAEADATTGWAHNWLTGEGANVFESQGAVKNAGSYAFHTDANDSPHNGAGIYVDLQAAPFSFTNGEQGRVQFDIRHIGSATGNGDWGAALAVADNELTNLIDTIVKGEVTFETWIYEWTHDANHRYLTIRESNSQDDGGVYADNLSVKKKI